MAGLNEDIGTKRSILFSTRLRCSPSGANILEESIQRILEQNLAVSESVNGLTESELNEIVGLTGIVPVLRAADVRMGIEKLLKNGRLQIVHGDGRTAYILSPTAKSENERIINESRDKYQEVVQNLFASASGRIKDYETAFLKLLCLVFSRLSDVYIRVIAGTYEKESFVEHQLLYRSIDEVSASLKIKYPSAFKYGVTRFFRESSPLFDNIKWNMAQNFYIAKVMGMDRKDHLLSADILKGSSFYLDTNVLIAGLIPGDRHHASFQELSKVCKMLNINIRAAQITISEFENTVRSHSIILSRVFDRIPIKILPKVKSFLLESYLLALSENPSLALEKYLANFQSPLKSLQKEFNIELIDDFWFDHEKGEKITEILSKLISKRYEELRNRPKRAQASLHDALLLRWVSHVTQSGDEKAWVVTLDISLVSCNLKDLSEPAPNVITLGALLHWATPQCINELNEDRLAEIYSEAISYHLLPSQVFLDLRDFQVFAEMDIETSQLPAEDVEACIEAIRALGPNINPGKPADREKVSREIQRYFVDPGTKYRRDIQSLNQSAIELENKIEEEQIARRQAEQRISELSEEAREKENEVVELSSQIEIEKKARQELETRLKSLEREQEHKKLINSLIIRTSLLTFALLVMWAIIGFAAWKWGDGQTMFMKLSSAKLFFELSVSGIGLISPIILGRNIMLLIRRWRGEL